MVKKNLNMKHLKKFEEIRINIQEPSTELPVDGFVVNGIFFLVGFREARFIKLSEKESLQLDKVISDVNEKYKNELLVKLVGTWLHGPFAAKYGVWIPGYIFQVPCKTEEIATNVAKDIADGLREISKGQICIAISQGSIKINKEDPFNSDGTAYHKSGRYIDDPNNCVDMIKSKEEIRMV